MNDLTIIMYHYVRHIEGVRFPKINALDMDDFEGQIKYLLKNYSILTMEEVIYSIDYGKRLPNNAVLLTFDDAYIDHYINVFPVLDSYNIQGSFYVPVKAITECSVLNVNKIHFILASAQSVRDIINDLFVFIKRNKDQYSLKNFDFYFKKLAKAGRYDKKETVFVKRLLQVELPENLRNFIVNELFDKYIGLSEVAFSKELYMDERQLKHMIRSGMHVGCHGYDHYWWNRLSKDKLSREIDLSLAFLRTLGVDMSKWTACYPYGSYDDQAVNMLKKRGCNLALTTDVGIAKVSKDLKLLMPRLNTNDFPVSVGANC